jgi:hypothetical protein
MDLQRFLIGLGLVILLAGIAWPILSRIGLGRLPGDIMFQRAGSTFYFPLVTCVIISIRYHKHRGQCAPYAFEGRGPASCTFGVDKRSAMVVAARSRFREV